MPPAWLAYRAQEPTFGLPARAKSGATTTASGSSLFYAFGAYPSATGIPVTPLTAMQVSTVYGCVKARSEDLAKVPLILRRKLPDGGYRAESAHPIARLLRRPNAWMTPFVFVRFIEQSICYRGNAYVVIKRGYAGEPEQLIPVTPDHVIVEIAPSGRVFYRITHPLVGDGKQLDQDNVLHVKNIGLDGGYVGISPIAAAQETVGLAIAAQQHGAALFRQGAQLNLAIKHPGKLSPDAKTYLSQAMAERFSGIDNAFKTPILDEGMEPVELGMSSEDAQLLGMRQYQRIEICAAFRVPPHKVMDLEHAHFANIENQNQDYIDDALRPDADQLAQEMRAKLLFEDEQDDLEFAWHWDDLLRADRKSRYDAHAIGLNNGFLSVNEVRGDEGMTRIEGGDEYRVALNTGRLSEMPTGAPGNTAPNPVPADAGGKD